MHKNKNTVTVNVNKIRGLAKISGITITSLCASIGRKDYYLCDVEKIGGKMPVEQLLIIADKLGTTVEYLTDANEKTVTATNEIWEKSENDRITVALFEMILKMSDSQRKRLYNLLK